MRTVAVTTLSNKGVCNAEKINEQLIEKYKSRKLNKNIRLNSKFDVLIYSKFVNNNHSNGFKLYLMI